eukprot:Plantae.Rhodophyta-Rhodochaete_pulchella.ctg3715.p2 GENE.Plantae.Rhodophyta-Rhodochaete_pulchella.ctg3715~~Plantae.Rhodophyta-Rhodochaete_pulchella.ctg3715.p2  ORF type:complete len:348 (+),score=40.43 Plantae.Rhodophyta-Rhodochaete_pulchella.ctg3715:51-1046(+)
MSNHGRVPRDAPEVTLSAVTPPILPIAGDGPPPAATGTAPGQSLPTPVYSTGGYTRAATGSGIVAPPPSRSFTKESEQEVLRAWETHLGEYTGGVRKRAVEKITKRANEALGYLECGPVFTEKQILNKISCMQKRYNFVRDKMSGSGFRMDDFSVGSLRNTVLKLSPLYFEVDTIIRSRPNVNPSIFMDIGGRSGEQSSQVCVLQSRNATASDAVPQVISMESPRNATPASSSSSSSLVRNEDSGVVNSDTTKKTDLRQNRKRKLSRGSVAKKTLDGKISRISGPSHSRQKVADSLMACLDDQAAIEEEHNENSREVLQSELGIKREDLFL